MQKIDIAARFRSRLTAGCVGACMPAIVLCVSMLSATRSDADITSGLVGYWQFDGSGSSAIDSSGNGNDGVLINSTWDAGRYGDAAQLSGNNDSHVSIPASESLDDFTDQITVTAWIFPRVAPQGFLAVASRQISTILHPDQFYLGFGPDLAVDGEMRFKWHLGTNFGFLYDESIYAGTPDSNRWIHMAGTYDGSRMRLYVDGVEIGNKQLLGQIQVDTCLNWEPDPKPPCVTGNPVTIGAEENGAQPLVVDGEFDGRIDEVRLYNRALSAAEILTIYQQAEQAACENGVDDDNDGLVDFPSDRGCASASDLDERSPFLACDDGEDNDGDGVLDFPADPGCRDPAFPTEAPACQDGVDNDGDGAIDFDGGASANQGVALGAPDPGCATASQSEVPSCGLGVEVVALAPLLLLIRRKRR